MEVVGGPAVVVVVDDGGEEEGEDLQVRHPVLQSSLGDAAVRGLQDVAGVQVVVVGGPVTEIVLIIIMMKCLNDGAIPGISYLQMSQQCLQSGGGYFEFVTVTVILDDLIT